MLSARATLMARLKDIENSVRGLLRDFGLRLPPLLRPLGRERANGRRRTSVLAAGYGPLAHRAPGPVRATDRARQAMPKGLTRSVAG
jgi:hypothetical protein